ncbi:MAG: hypothetical protein KBD21_02850 [Candidatus Pacebacteria bacterium]|nr:hypothetical protein [Candidatus Paceibacterota bacterium]
MQTTSKTPNTALRLFASEEMLVADMVVKIAYHGLFTGGTPACYNVVDKLCVGGGVVNRIWL